MVYVEDIHRIKSDACRSRFCDESCNNVACGYDGGDCGASRFRRLHQLDVSYDAATANFSLEIPKGVAVAFWNISAVKI
jgi:hypothetical protein